MGERLEDWLPNKRRLLLWENGGFYWLDVDANGTPSVPGSQRAWRAFRDHGPPAMVRDAYHLLRDWLEVQAARKTGPYAAARFGEKAREWLINQKLNRQRAEGEKDGLRTDCKKTAGS